MWELSFITEEQLKHHVVETIRKYGEKLEPYDLKRFNSNIIDPIKLIFDKLVYSVSWEEIIKNETFRQRDKSNSNDIGYFHQNIFQYFNMCRVPINGSEGSWDIIFECPEGIKISDNISVSKIYVEMKNKHNTMNSSSAAKTYMRMQNQLLKEKNCACFLVEAIAKTSQNITWETTLDKEKVSHPNIRRVSIDRFYDMVTGEENAFYKLCIVLPKIIEGLVQQNASIETPKDTVFEELKKIADTKGVSMAMAIYLLGFSSYKGFKS